MPETSRKQLTRPEDTAPVSHYPIALVPGQFQEYYRKLSAAEILYVNEPIAARTPSLPSTSNISFIFRCYPINTALADPEQLDRRLRECTNRIRDSDSEDESDDDDSSSSGSGSSSSGSSDSSDVSIKKKKNYSAYSNRQYVHINKIAAFPFQDSSDSSTSEDEEEEDLEEMVEIDGKQVAMPTRKKIDPTIRGKCSKCQKPDRSNPHGRPELFVECSLCRREGKTSIRQSSAHFIKSEKLNFISLASSFSSSKLHTNASTYG